MTTAGTRGAPHTEAWTEPKLEKTEGVRIGGYRQIGHHLPLPHGATRASAGGDLDPHLDLIICCVSEAES